MSTELLDGVSPESDRVKELERRLQNLERENRHLKRTMRSTSPSPIVGKPTDTLCLLETLADVDLNELLDDADEDSW